MSKFLRRLKFLVNFRRFIPFLLSYFKSKEVSSMKKVTAIILIITYVAIPFDFIPDFLMVVGIVDDLAVIAFIMQFLIKTAPKGLREKYELKE